MMEDSALQEGEGGGGHWTAVYSETCPSTHTTATAPGQSDTPNAVHRRASAVRVRCSAPQAWGRINPPDLCPPPPPPRHRPPRGLRGTEA